MGLDVGDLRIGIALTDELGYSAHPLVTLARYTLREDVESIAQLIREYGVVEVVVGNPLSMSGAPSPKAAGSRALAQSLAQYIATKRPRILPIPVIHLWGERVSITRTHRHIDDIGPHRPEGARRRNIADETAAVLILQAFIDSRTPLGS
jgi:putative Holliday junction resolvase